MIKFICLLLLPRKKLNLTMNSMNFVKLSQNQMNFIAILSLFLLSTKNKNDKLINKQYLRIYSYKKHVLLINKNI